MEKSAGQTNADGSSDHMKTVILEDLLNVSTFRSAIFKFDVEGHEWYLLEDIRAIMDNFNVPLFIIHSNYHYLPLAETCLRLYDIMAAKGYVPYHNPIKKQKENEIRCKKHSKMFWLKQF